MTTTSGGVVRADQVVIGTNASPSPVRRHRPYPVPVWDHLLVTQPLGDRRVADLGWSGFDS